MWTRWAAKELMASFAIGANRVWASETRVFHALVDQVDWLSANQVGTPKGMPSEWTANELAHVVSILGASSGCLLRIRANIIAAYRHSGRRGTGELGPRYPLRARQPGGDKNGSADRRIYPSGAN